MYFIKWQVERDTQPHFESSCQPTMNKQSTSRSRLLFESEKIIVAFRCRCHPEKVNQIFVQPFYGFQLFCVRLYFKFQYLVLIHHLCRQMKQIYMHISCSVDAVVSKKLLHNPDFFIFTSIFIIYVVRKIAPSATLPTAEQKILSINGY